MNIRHYYGNLFQIEIDKKDALFEQLILGKLASEPLFDERKKVELANSIFSYIKITKSPWPEIEPFLISLKEKDILISYAEFLKTRFLNAEKSIVEGGHKAIKKYFELIKHFGLDDENFTADLEKYYLDHLKKISELEDVERTICPYMSACDYAIEIKKGRWAEAEEIIINDAEAAFRYAQFVMKSRWPEAEPLILNSKPENSYNIWILNSYLDALVCTRWPEAEPFIMQHPNFALSYTKKYLHGRWEDAEPFIKQSPVCAYTYALDIIKDRWVEAEEFIAQSANLSYEYAKHIIKGKLPEEMHNRIIILAMQYPKDPYLKKYLKYKKYKKETVKSK